MYLHTHSSKLFRRFPKKKEERKKCDQDLNISRKNITMAMKTSVYT